MDFDIKAARAAWTKLKRRDWAEMPAKVKVDKMPSFPLANAIKMPEETPFPLGSLALRLSKLKIISSDDFVPDVERVWTDRKRTRVTLRFGEASIRGRHALEGKQIWDANLDGAGTGLTFDDEGRVRHPGGAEENKNPTWIATAKAQRDKLIDEGGDNGATLVSTYTEHRLSFTDVLTQDAGYPFQTGWSIPSITEMAGHTNDCMTNSNVINDGTKTYDNGKNYNINAALQQLAMLTTLAGMPGATKDNKPVPDSPYTKAAVATANFNSSVLTNTGAKKTDDIPDHTSDEVYTLIQKGKPGPEVTADQVHKLLNGDEIGGRSADGSAWSMVLSEDERAFVRDIQARQREHLERVAAAKPVTLSGGSMIASLPEFYMYIEFTIAENGTASFSDARVELDSFDLELDDGEWPEFVAALAREELGKARFIRSLIHDRVADALERDLVDPAVSVLTRTG